MVRPIRLFLTLAVFLGVVLLAAFAPLVLAAAPPQPTHTSAEVDGDFLAKIFTASDSTKDVLSIAFLRSDCSEITGTALFSRPLGCVASSIYMEK